MNVQNYKKDELKPTDVNSIHTNLELTDFK